MSTPEAPPTHQEVTEEPSLEDDEGTRGGATQPERPGKPVAFEAIAWWRTQAILRGGVLVVLIGVVHVFNPGIHGVTGALVPLVSILTAAYAAWVPVRRYEIHRWDLTEDAVHASSGWWTHDTRMLPLSRVQTVDTERGPLQRLCGVTTIVVTSASAVGPVEIPGLRADVAEVVAARLTQAAHAARGDAT